MESDKTSRFSVSDKQKASYEEAAVNKNTKKSTETWFRTYLEWANEKKKPKSIENLSPEELDEVLGDFYTELKKKDGSDYEPESLGVMQASLDRYLKNKGYKVSIIRGREFAKSNKILKGKAITLRHEGKGTRPNATDALTWEEEEMLWKEGRLGRHTPEVLLNTTWYLVSQHFGLRGRQENYDLRVEHFKFAKDENGRTYVTFADSNPTKTRKSSIKLQRRMVIPRMVATGGERCPVSIFEEFISRRPSEFKESGPLYLAINYKPKSNIWYKAQRMGLGKIGKIMQSIVEGTSVEESNKRVAGHMPRKTLVRKLDQLGYSRDEISAVTGHSNIKSLDSYLDTMNERKSTELSLAVSGISRKAQQMQNPSSSVSSATQLVVQEDSAVQQRSMSTTTSQMCASTHSFITSTTTADTQLHQLPPIHLSSIGNNISGQATINITFNIQPPQ